MALIAWLWLAATIAAPPLLVLPAEGPGDEETAWVAESVADEMPRAFERLGVPNIDRIDRLRAQDALGIPRSALTRATSIKIAEALGASRLVVGSYTIAGSQLTLTLRLLDVERATLSAPFVAAGPVESLFEMIQRLAWDIALSGPTRPKRPLEEVLAMRAAVPLEARKAYAQGLAAGAPGARAKLWQRALGLAPGYDEARVALGRLQLETREPAMALETLARVPAWSPLARAARFLQGAALFGIGRYREAAALYAGLASEEPSGALLNNHALALLRSRDNGPVRPSQVLRKALEEDPEVAQVPFNLGWALLFEGDLEAAEFWMRGVLREEPNDTQARVVLSWVLRRAGRDDEAAEEWRAVLEAAPGYAALELPDLARRFERLLEYERTPALAGQRAPKPVAAAAHQARAEALMSIGDSDAALRELTQGVVVDPYHAGLHVALARVHAARRDLEKAAGELRMALWCRDDPNVRLELARTLKELGKVGDARLELERVLRLEPGNEAARRLLESLAAR